MHQKRVRESFGMEVLMESTAPEKDSMYFDIESIPDGFLDHHDHGNSCKLIPLTWMETFNPVPIAIVLVSVMLDVSKVVKTLGNESCHQVEKSSMRRYGQWCRVS